MPAPESAESMTTMQNVSATTGVIERMLASADHWAGRHGQDPSIPAPSYPTPHLPAGWIVYSASYAFSRQAPDQAPKGWHVTLMGSSTPFEKSSMVSGSNRNSLDGALLDASRKITGSQQAARA